MISFFKLIRFPNLLMIALTMYLVRYCLLVEFDGTGFVQVTYTLSNFGFFLLVLSTVLIAAGGNIINDYFDTSIDAINKPTKLIIGVKISRRIAMLAHIIMSTLGILTGIFLAWKLHHIRLGLINIFSVTLLWYYSRLFKRRILVGNIVIAFLSGLVPLVVALFEPQVYGYLNIVLIYSVFAFILTFIREIIKDLEDIQGDRMENCRTLPVVVGETITKYVVMGLAILTAAFIIYFQRILYTKQDYITLLYATAAVEIPLIILIIFTYMAHSKNQYKNLSLLAKLIMITGILSMYVFYYSLNHPIS